MEITADDKDMQSVVKHVVRGHLWGKANVVL